MVIPFSFQIIRDPDVLEGALPHLSSLLLMFFNGSFIGSTTCVGQAASSGRLAGIYVSNDDIDIDIGIDVSVFLAHFGFDLVWFS